MGMAALIAIFFLPTFVAGITYTPVTDDTVSDAPERANASDVTFVSVQGRWQNGFLGGGKLHVIDTKTKEPLWIHDEGRKYYDIDPLNETHILFSVKMENKKGEWARYAAIANWREGQVTRKFRIPPDTHDIDKLEEGNDNYAVARLNSRVFILNATTREEMWEYRFETRFPPTDGGGLDADFTHLNDIDSVDNGTKFLVSPRNFDRVMLINRSTKEIEWTLGEQDNYDILYKQHNPALIHQDPPTVLIADSENDRILEYEKQGQKWKLVWGYRGTLNWPRDADRLPNGNTMIVDSRGDRVLEITPDREIVWEYETEAHPYDIERLQHGDEPTGPPMREFSDEFDKPLPRPATHYPVVGILVSSFQSAYDLAGWALPTWVGEFEFLLLLFGTLSMIGWVGLEARIQLPDETVYRIVYPGRYVSIDPIIQAGGILSFVLGIGLLIRATAPSNMTSSLVAIGLLLTVASWRIISEGIDDVSNLLRSLLAIGRLIVISLGIIGGLGLIGITYNWSTWYIYCGAAVGIIILTLRLLFERCPIG